MYLPIRSSCLSGDRPALLAGGRAAMTDMPVTIAAVRKAAAAIDGAIAHTPVVPALAISELASAEIHLKLETLHRTGSFKERGALAKLLTLDPSARRAGVVAMSAGNHAQGVAYHARRA